MRGDSLDPEPIGLHCILSGTQTRTRLKENHQEVGTGLNATRCGGGAECGVGTGGAGLREKTGHLQEEVPRYLHPHRPKQAPWVEAAGSVFQLDTPGDMDSVS